MKKLVFTALAVVAFSGVSIAGNKEVLNKKVVMALRLADCRAAGMEAFLIVRDMGGTFDQCHAARIRVERACNAPIQ